MVDLKVNLQKIKKNTENISNGKQSQTKKLDLTCKIVLKMIESSNFNNNI
jgi:hypothetical protein